MTWKAAKRKYTMYRYGTNEHSKTRLYENRRVLHLYCGGKSLFNIFG